MVVPARSATCFAILPFAAAAIVSVAGCGKSNGGTVTGTLVHKDGSPLAAARVVLHSKDSGSTAYGTTDKGGYFKIDDGLSPGDYDVNILEASGDPEKRLPRTIAAKYRDPAKSGLTVSVQAGHTATLNPTLDPP